VTSATDRYKMLLANALERVCVLETELEQARERVAELEARDEQPIPLRKTQVD
jgi:hypothetical protein